MPVAFPPAPSGVEIRILQRLFTPEEAEIALELSAIPEPVATIHRRFGSRIPLDELRRKLEHMADKGIILSFPAGGEMRFGKLIFAIGMYERQLKTLTPEFERDSRQYSDEAFGRAFHTGKTTQLRIVPVNKQIAVGAQSHHLRPHPRLHRGVPRAVRRLALHLPPRPRSLDEPCRQTKLRDNCLMIGPAARWAVESGNGQAVTREQMLDLLDQADRDGLVLQPENTKAPMFVCCCCGCCCGVLRSAKRLPHPADFFSSNFYAVADAEACESCGVCETRCQMDAITSPEGKAVVDRSRCIGCALCLTTCPSGALRLQSVDHPKEPPDDIKALYLKLFEDRFGRWGMAKLGARKLLGMKI